MPLSRDGFFKFMPEIEIQMRQRKKVVGKRWRMDETYSVPGSLRYYIAVTRAYLKYTFVAMPCCEGI